MIVNKTKFAALAHVNKSSVGRACTAGFLVAMPNGNLETDNLVNKDYISVHVAKWEAKQKKLYGATNTGNEEQENVDNFDPSQSIGLSLEDILSGKCTTASLQGLEILSIEKLKSIEQFRKLQLETQKKRNELVSREAVQKVFAKLYMIDVNQWRTLGANITPLIASAASIDSDTVMIKITEIIEKKVFVILQQIKKEITDHLVDIEAEELPNTEDV